MGIVTVRPTEIVSRTGPANRLLLTTVGDEFHGQPVLLKMPENGDGRGSSLLVGPVNMVDMDQPKRRLEITFVDESVEPVRVDVDEEITVQHVRFLVLG